MDIAALPEREPAVRQWQAGAFFASAESFLEREREQAPLWLVVALGGGIAAWLVLADPARWWAFLLLAAGGSVVGFALVPGRAGRAVGAVGIALALGLGLIWVRAEAVRSPQLQRIDIVRFEAEVKRVERLAARESLRLTLAPRGGELPPLLRVSLAEKDAPEGLGPGARIALRARLTPPQPMTLPGTHDFGRDAWFAGLGGTGRALGEIEVLSTGQPGVLDGARTSLDEHIRARLEGGVGGIATALATGDQGHMPAEDAEAMRRAGLAHLLSVSGLHIAAAVGAAFLLTLRLLALSERLALRVNLVLVAAGTGALAGVAYTLLTGAQVPTVRSCIAAILVLIGIALGREALSLRLIAVGAAAVLLVRPEAVAGASFQLSFAAVTTLVALYSSRHFIRWFERREESWAPKLARALGAMVVTGLAVEFALMPFALYHFHKAGLYGVLANLVAIPLTTFVIMPLEAGALLLDLVGLGGWLWVACGWVIGLLLWLAHTVSSASGAVAMLPTMPVWAFGAMVIGGLWLCLWSTRVRLFGLAAILMGAVGATTAPRPDLLITGDGRHVAIIAADGTPFILRERAGDYVRSLLAETSGFDGDLPVMPQSGLARCSYDSCIADLMADGRTWSLLALRSTQRLAWEDLTAACRQADIVVADRRLPRGCTPRWLKLDSVGLARTGGLALYLGEEPRVESVSEQLGRLPWAGLQSGR